MMFLNLTYCYILAQFAQWHLVNLGVEIHPNWLRADFQSLQKLLAVILLQKNSIMQELAANILMRISIVKIVCECFLP